MPELDIPSDLFLENDMNDADVGLIKLGLHQTAVVAQQGHASYSENLRYDYLEGKNSQSISEGLGLRMATESGSGRTRSETNAPAATSAGQ